MGQGSSRLNWECSCEDGKINLSATYEDQKFNTSETTAEEHQKTREPTAVKKATPINKQKKVSTSKDTLLPIMDVESSLDEPNKNTKLRRTFSSCDLVYTKPAMDSRRLQSRQGGRGSVRTNKNSQQYRSHEVLSSAGSSSANTESSGLSQSNSEISLNSSKSVDSKLHRVFGTSNLYKTKQDQSDQLNKEKSNNNVNPSQHPPLERKLSVNSTTSTGSTERKSSIGDISSLGELLKKKKKEARRAEIVANVTRRLYSNKKVDIKPEPVEVVPEQEDKQEEDDEEPEELKLCMRARAKLQELSKKAISGNRWKLRRSYDGETQTDFDSHVLRVKEVAVSTEELDYSPQIFFTENRRFLISNCVYPSMRLQSPWCTLSTRNHNSFSNDDSFSDDSLDSLQDLDKTEEKPSVWNVISIKSGKHFNEEYNESDHILKSISTQTLKSIIDDARSSIENEDINSFSTPTNDIICSVHENVCEYNSITQEDSECIHDIAEQQADSNCGEEPPDKDADNMSLNETDRHLYTITESSEHSDCNDVTFGDYDFYVSHKSENDTISFPVVCSCRTVIKTCSICHIPTSITNRSPNVSKSMLCPNHNTVCQQQSDKTTQTTDHLHTCCGNERNSVCSTIVRQHNNKITTLQGNIKMICKHCKKPLLIPCNTEDVTFNIPFQNTRTQGTQYSLTHLPTDAGTQTMSMLLPNMNVMCPAIFGNYSDFSRLSNPNLQINESIAILFNGDIVQPAVIKPVRWNNNWSSDSVAVQTDGNIDKEFPEVNAELDEGAQVCTKKQSSVSGTSEKAQTESNFICQSASDQTTSQHITSTLPVLGCSSEEPQIIRQHCNKTESSSTTTAEPYQWEQNNFSDDDDDLCLPRASVAPMHASESTGYQHWAEIRNLILGRDGNAIPYSIDIQEDSHRTQQAKNIKKKSVSWSDLSGYGALHTEMIFPSDHNLYDSSQASPSKITKSSLLDVMGTETLRPPSSREMIMSSPPLEQSRSKNKKFTRSLSLADMNELSNRNVDGKLHLSAFLREASALVTSLSQATRLLEKGRQLNAGDDAFSTVHNKLWMTTENAPCVNPTNYPGPSSLPATVSSQEHVNQISREKRNVLTQHKSLFCRSKDSNINTQIRLNQIYENKNTSYFYYSDRCSRHDVHEISSLPDCSKLSTNHWHYCCAFHHSVPHVSTLDESTFSFCPRSCKLGSPRAYRQHLVAIRRQIIRASLPSTYNNSQQFSDELTPH